MVKVAAPGLAAVPVNAPVADNASPAGREPELTAQVYGETPPLAVIVQTAPESALPTMGFGSAVVAMVGWPNINEVKRPSETSTRRIILLLSTRCA
jgi:hypothetical protein